MNPGARFREGTLGGVKEQIGGGQHPQSYSYRAGLTHALGEAEHLHDTWADTVRENAFGPDHEKITEASAELSKDSPLPGYIISKQRAGITLDPTEEAFYQANKPVLDAIREGSKQVFQTAVAEGDSTGKMGEDYSAVIRPLSSRFYRAMPDEGGTQGQGAKYVQSSQKSVDQFRLHKDVIPHYDPMEAANRYIDKIASQRIYDPLIKSAEALRDTLKQFEQTGTESTKGEREFVENWIDHYAKGFNHPMDNESFKRLNRGVADASVGVGDEFTSKGKLHPLQPTGKIKVIEADPRGRFQISVDGNPKDPWYTTTEINAMRGENTLVHVNPISRWVQNLASLAFHSWVGWRPDKFIPAAVSNIARTLSSESVGYLRLAAVDLAKTMARGPERRAWLREAGRLDLLSSGVLEMLSRKSGVMTALHTVGSLPVALPDMLQKPVMYEASRLRLRDLHGPNSAEPWSEQKIKTRALAETALVSDLSGKAYQAPASQHPLGQAAYLFQKAQLRTFERISSIWHDPNISNVERGVKLGVITGIPAAFWLRSYYAHQGSFTNATRQAFEFLPFLNFATNLPGFASLVDALDGKSENRFAKYWLGHDTPMFDVRAWTQGNPRAFHAGEFGEPKKRGRKRQP